jgi:hypothetical protein
LQKEPYNSDFTISSENPIDWWNTIFDGGNQLQRLAIKLFSISPNSASCERQFSTLGWFIGKRRQCLSIETLESLGKVHRYIITNTKKELNYINKEYTEEYIKNLVLLATVNNDDQYEEIEEENVELNNDEFDLEDSLIDEEIQSISLNIENIIDLGPWIYIDPLNIPQITNIENSDDENNDEFNVDTLVIEELSKNN